MTTKTVGGPLVPGGFPVPVDLETFRFIVNGAVVMAVDIPTSKLLMDVPEATNKMFTYTLDPAETYQEETRVDIATGRVTYIHAPIKGRTSVSPNLRRNEFSGEFDVYNVYKLPSTPTP